MIDLNGLQKGHIDPTYKMIRNPAKKKSQLKLNTQKRKMPNSNGVNNEHDKHIDEYV